MDDLDEKQRQVEEKEYEQQRKLYELQIDDKIKQREIKKKEGENKRRMEELRLNDERFENEERFKAEDRRKKLEQKVFEINFIRTLFLIIDFFNEFFNKIKRNKKGECKWKSKESKNQLKSKN
jgi:hypothetical protein